MGLLFSNDFSFLPRQSYPHLSKSVPTLIILVLLVIIRAQIEKHPLGLCGEWVLWTFGPEAGTPTMGALRQAPRRWGRGPGCHSASSLSLAGPFHPDNFLHGGGGVVGGGTSRWTSWRLFPYSLRQGTAFPP